jgi:4-aminobutyrate aminotransferase
LRYDPALNPHILDVRGRGLMVGVEFASPAATSRQQDASAPTTSSSPHYSTVTHPKNMAARVAKRCIEKGMLILTTSVYEVIRFVPPLNVSKEEMRKGCDIFSESVREIVKEG